MGTQHESHVTHIGCIGRNTNGGPDQQIATVTGTAHDDRTVSAGQTYYYAVVASDGLNQSVYYSNESVAVIPNPKPNERNCTP